VRAAGGVGAYRRRENGVREGKQESVTHVE